MPFVLRARASRLAPELGLAADEGTMALTVEPSDRARTLPTIQPATRSVHTGLALLVAAAVTVSVQLPVIASEPGFVAINVAVVVSMVALGCYLAHKHARHASVEVRPTGLDGMIELTVEDHGPGGAVVRPGGGIAGLQERAAELGGALILRSTPDVGTTLTVRIPPVPA